MGKITLSYLLFYAALIGFFAAMQLDGYLIGNNPAGLCFRPMPPERNVKSTLVWYNASDANSTFYWRDQLDQFLKPYHKPLNSETSIVACWRGDPPKLGSNEVCHVRVDNWFPCTASNGYNYNSTEGGPCIFLKLNKIFGWVPDYYNTSAMPDNMPRNLKDVIRQTEKDQGPDANNLKVVWVSCEGENSTDVENIGPINYYPYSGFGGQYFPFTNVNEYLSPLVAVHFSKPARGVLINIECKAWARNIVHDRQDRRGSVHFELLVDY